MYALFMDYHWLPLEQKSPGVSKESFVMHFYLIQPKMQLYGIKKGQKNNP